jgi:PAS domain S-box-containing protein
MEYLRVQRKPLRAAATVVVVAVLLELIGITSALPVRIIYYAAAAIMAVLWFRLISTEQKLALATTAAARTREKLFGLLKISPDLFVSPTLSVILTDADHKVIDVNDTFSLVTGYDRSDLLGETPSVLSPDDKSPAAYKELWDSLAAKGSWAGVLLDRLKSGEVYSHKCRVEALLDHNKDVVGYLIVCEAADRKQTTEAPTTMPGRRELQDVLTRAIATAKKSKKFVALVNIGADHADQIAKLYGPTSSEIMQGQTIERLRNVLPVGSFISQNQRGDFEVVIQDLPDSTLLETTVSQLQNELSQPFALANEKTATTFSMGVACYPTDAQNFIELINASRAALETAKTTGGSRYQYFNPELDNDARVDLIRRSLPEALFRGQLSLKFQPIFELATGRVHKAEVFIRWDHPTLGAISPGTFIPLAEVSGLILKFEAWVLEQTLECAASVFEIDPGFEFDVNASISSLMDKNFSIDDYREAFRRHNVPLSTIAFEITEKALLQDAERLNESVSALSRAGFKIGLDDFGVGLSSLSHLKKVTLQHIKINPSFVQAGANNRTDEHVFEAIIALAHSLNIQAIAKGLESKAQVELLTKAGCDLGQGYFFADPMDFEELLRLVKNQQQTPPETEKVVEAPAGGDGDDVSS